MPQMFLKAPPTPAGSTGKTGLKSAIQRNGHVLRGIRYAFIAADYRALTTSEILEWSHALRLYRGQRSRRDRSNFCTALRRACDRLCDRAGRSETGRGRPWLWVLKEGE